jgi:hypothetical protein
MTSTVLFDDTVSATVLSDTSLHINWDEASTNIPAPNDGIVYNITWVSDTDPSDNGAATDLTDTSLGLTDLTPGTTYSVTVTAVDAGGADQDRATKGKTSSTITFDGNASAIVMSDTSFWVRWSEGTTNAPAPNDNVTYNLSWALQSDPDTVLGSVTDLAQTVTEYTINGLDPATFYRVTITAVDGASIEKNKFVNQKTSSTILWDGPVTAVGSDDDKVTATWPEDATDNTPNSILEYVAILKDAKTGAELKRIRMSGAQASEGSAEFTGEVGKTYKVEVTVSNIVDDTPQPKTVESNEVQPGRPSNLHCPLGTQIDVENGRVVTNTIQASGYTFNLESSANQVIGELHLASSLLWSDDKFSCTYRFGNSGKDDATFKTVENLPSSTVVQSNGASSNNGKYCVTSGTDPVLTSDQCYARWGA